MAMNANRLAAFCLGFPDGTSFVGQCACGLWIADPARPHAMRFCLTACPGPRQAGGEGQAPGGAMGIRGELGDFLRIFELIY